MNLVERWCKYMQRPPVLKHIQSTHIAKKTVPEYIFFQTAPTDGTSILEHPCRLFRIMFHAERYEPLQKGNTNKNTM